MNQTLYDKIETCVVVTVIAMLIWLYAEGENVTTDQAFVTVQFEAAAGQNLHIEPGEGFAVQVQFTCATSQLAQVKNLGTITIPVSTDTNETIVLAALLAGEFEDAGASIIETNPPTSELKVELMDSLTLQVQVDRGELALKVQPTAVPAEVKVHGPASAIQLLEGAILEAPLGDVDVDPAAREDERPETVPVQVRLPARYDAKNLTFEPPTVEVTFTILKLEDTTKLTGVGILLAFRPRGFNDYIVETDNEQLLLDEVTVTGPSDIIKDLTSQDVTAILVLTQQELETGSGSKQLIFITSRPGVVVVQSPHTLGYTATLRTPESP